MAVGEQTASRETRRATLAAACSVHFVHDGISDALYVLLPAWSHAFGLSYAQVGVLRTAYSASLAALQMPAGMLAERAGERALLAAGTVLAGAAFMLLAISQSYALLAILILTAGVGSAVQHPLSSVIISRTYAAAARRAALGVYNFAGDLGKMCVAAGVGLAVALIGWRSTVVGYGLVVVTVGVASLFIFRRLIPAPADPTADIRMAVSGSGWGFTNARGFALLGAVHVLDSACRTGLLTFLPFLLVAKGATPAAVGFGLALIFVGGAAGKLLCGLLAERIGILRTVIVTELATALMIVLAILLPLSWQMALLVPLGVALNGTSSVLYGTVAEFVRDDRQARSFGLFYTLGSCASASSPLVFGILSDLSGVPVALYAIAALALATLPLAALMRTHLAN
jgi:FSR family fosmidomycin resistance protein-like MFS transporter